jgi:hypothetical protein
MAQGLYWTPFTTSPLLMDSARGSIHGKPMSYNAIPMEGFFIDQATEPYCLFEKISIEGVSPKSPRIALRRTGN